MGARLRPGLAGLGVLATAVAAQPSSVLAQEHPYSDVTAETLPTGEVTDAQLASIDADQAGESPADDGSPIVITGTRIKTPNRTSTSPVETVRTEDFILTGVPNVEQTLNQLPQLVPSFTNTSNNPGTGAATLDLRGLGSVRTLILVNGRRWIASDAGQIPEVDVNTIPSALIDRVDIVTGGASAVYGSDAVTGVVNFVLKDRVEGLHVEARSNLTEKADGQSLSADVTYGTSFLDGRGSLIASAGWLDQQPVLQGDRDFSRVALGDACVIAGSQDKLGVGTPAFSFDCTGPGEQWGLIALGSGTIPESRFFGRLLVPGPPGMLPT